MFRGGQWVLCARQAEGPRCPEDTGPEAAVTSPRQSPVTSALGRERDTLERQQGQTLLGGSRHCPARPRGERDPQRGGQVGAADSPMLGGCRAPWGQLRGAGLPALSQAYAAQHGHAGARAARETKSLLTGSRGCRAPTARGQPGPAPPGKSSLPCSLGRTPSPAHSQSPAPPARMTHSSILSVFTLQCQRRQAAWALQWVPIKDGPWQPEGRGKGSAGSLASRDCPEAAAQLSQRNRVWLSPPSGGVWAMPKAAPRVTAAPGARNHHNWERNPVSNRRGKSPIALR